MSTLHRRGTRIAIACGLTPFDADAWEADPLRWWRDERRLSP